MEARAVSTSLYVLRQESARYREIVLRLLLDANLSDDEIERIVG